MAGVSFLDLLFAEATGMARVRDARSREPDNFFLLPRDPRAWRQIRAASKKENMVIAVEITDNVNENCQRMQRVFVDLAREFDCIPFMRVEIGGGEGGTYDELRDDLGGIQFTPTFTFVFFSEKGIQRAKYEGPAEIQQGLQSGTMKEIIRELQKRRVQLKSTENLAEKLVGHVKDSIDEREAKLRREYEEKLRKQMEEKERSQRMEEEVKKKLEEEKKRQEEKEIRKQEEKKQKVAKECAEARPQVLRELLSLDLDTISSRDIKAIMLKLNISAHDCFEREDLKKKLIDNVPELRMKLEREEKRRQLEEKERAQRMEEEVKKKLEEEMERLEEEEIYKLETKKRKVAKERIEARPQVIRELLSLDLDTASSRDIKAIMIKLGIPPHDCFEKKDLKKKLIDNVPELRRKLEREERRESSSSVF